MKLLGRLLKTGGKKAVKKTVKTTASKAKTLAAKRRALVEKSRKAARTKVQTAPASRKVGTKAKLNGKEVYWGGKDYGWQSKASLTKLTNTPKKKPTAPKKSSTYPVSKSDKSPLVGRSRAKAAQRSKKDQGYDSREERLAVNRAQARKPKKVADKKGVKASEPQATSRQYTRGTTPKSRTTTTKTEGVKAPKAKPPVTKSQALTAKQRQRRLTTKNRDIGAKAAAARIDATKGGASVARGDIKSTSRGATKTSTLKETAARATNQRKIEARRGKELGNDVDTGRQVRLSAADARAAADQYMIDKQKEITKTSRTMSGMEASRYRQKAEREMKREAAKIRQNARSRSLTTRRTRRNNASPSHSSQNPKDLVNNTSSRRSYERVQKEGERLSKDMQRRKDAGQLKPFDKDKPPTKPSNPASTAEGLKRGKPSPTGRPTPNRETPPKKYVRRSTLSKAEREAREKALDSKTRKPKTTPTKPGPKGSASDRSVITNKNAPETVKERKANSNLRRRNQSDPKPSTAAQRRALQRAEGSNRVRGRDANDRARLRKNTDASSSKSGRSEGATTKAQQAVAATRKRQAVRDAANKALQKEFMSNF